MLVEYSLSQLHNTVSEMNPRNLMPRSVYILFHVISSYFLSETKNCFDCRIFYQTNTSPYQYVNTHYTLNIIFIFISPNILLVIIVTLKCILNACMHFALVLSQFSTHTTPFAFKTLNAVFRQIKQDFHMFVESLRHLISSKDRRI